MSEPVIREEQPELNEPARKASKARSGPKWETDAKERLRTAIRKYSKPLNDLMTRDSNEGDTRLLVTDFLRDGLGYDTYEDLTTEYQVRGEYADYGVRIDGELIAFIEVKRVKTKLAAKQLRQVEMYAVNEGVEWAILTNGAEWAVYHLGTRTPIEIDLALEVNLLGDATLGEKVNELFFLTRDSFKRPDRRALAGAPRDLAEVACRGAVVGAGRGGDPEGAALPHRPARRGGRDRSPPPRDRTPVGVLRVAASGSF